MVQTVQLTKENLRRKNFTPDEFFVSDTAYRLNHDSDPNNDIVNYPSPAIEQAILPCLMSTADMMQEIRDILFAEWKKRLSIFRQVIDEKKFFLKILSAYRCLKLNTLIGGSKSSDHIQGLATDSICPAFGTPEEIMKFLADFRYPDGSRFIVDQCFVEDSWLHIGKKMQKSANRMMFGWYLFDKKLNKRVFKPYVKA